MYDKTKYVTMPIINEIKKYSNRVKFHSLFLYFCNICRIKPPNDARRIKNNEKIAYVVRRCKMIVIKRK